MKMFRFLLCLITGVLISPLSVRANVYATDIKVNGHLTSASTSVGIAASISYILNQTADLGVTVSVWQGTNVVASMPGGTNMGLNSVSWTPTVSGTYALSITAAASDISDGTSNWTQISIDGPNTAANYPLGMDVDKNTNSPYYGRVVVGCAIPGTIYGVTQYDGLYKANADGSPADEGAFGYAGYVTNDAGFVGTNQMSDLGEPYHNYGLPGLIRIAGDDRIYFIDQSDNGSVVACDILATSNQVVICEGPGNSNEPAGELNTALSPSFGYPNCSNNYSGNPDGGDLNYYGEGWGQFDVAGFETGHPAIYLCDFGDYPSAGVWMYHLTNGAADPADTVGTQCIYTDGTYFIVTSAGLSVDTKLDVFVGQTRESPSAPFDRVFEFTNWNDGVLPPEGDGSADNYSLAVNATNTVLPAWMVGEGSAGLTDLNDTVINSRFNPTMVAVPTFPQFGGPTYTNSQGVSGAGGLLGGITVLSALDGSSIVTNLDIYNWYSAAAFDNVGNVYGCSPTTNYWRVWSPPGANTNTTVAVAQIVVGAAQLKLSTISAVPTGPNSANITINFTAPGNPPLLTLTLLGSSTLNGTFTAVPGAMITGSGGSYQATVSATSAVQFYIIEETQ
jgi:hypothetical protein